MIVAELVTLAAILLAAFLSIRRVEKTFTDRLAEQDEAEKGRQLALYKQQKATAKAVAQSDTAVRKLADRTSHLQGEAERALQKIDRFVSDQKKAG